MRSTHQTSLLKGAVAGLIGGVVASWAANQFHSLWSALQGEEQDPEVAKLSDRGGRPDTAEAKEKASAGERSGEGSERDATVKVAEKFSRGVLHRPLKPEEKHPAGVAVHYLFGAVGGAAYGAAAEVLPSVTSTKGAGFGIGVWLAAVEVGLPALKLAKPPWKYPFRMHAYSLLSHLIYGCVTEEVRARMRGDAGQQRARIKPFAERD